MWPSGCLWDKPAQEKDKDPHRVDVRYLQYPCIHIVKDQLEEDCEAWRQSGSFSRFWIKRKSRVSSFIHAGMGGREDVFLLSSFRC